MVIANIGLTTSSIVAASVTAGGGNFDSTGCTNTCTSALAPSATCTVGVRMRGLTNGSYTGTLQVAATQGGTVTVPLSGSVSGVTLNAYEIVSGRTPAGNTSWVLVQLPQAVTFSAGYTFEQLCRDLGYWPVRYGSAACCGGNGAEAGEPTGAAASAAKCC